MNITVYTSFSKRKNSTKQPTGGTLVSNVELKKSTSIHSPTFILGAITGVTMESITYVKAFGNYYYVGDISVTPHGYYEIACSEDPMATEKSGILASTQYVTRSASNYNIMIVDQLISMTRDTYVGEHIGQTASLGFSDIGYYVLECVNNLGTGCPEFTAHYLMDSENINKMSQLLFSTTDNNIFTNLLQELKKATESPYDSIISIRWIPYDLASVVSHVGAYALNDTVRLGPCLMDFNGVAPKGYLITNPSTPGTTFTDLRLITDTASMTFTADDAGEWRYKDDFRLQAPYTRAQLYIPGYGYIDINPLECAYGVSVERVLDILTGDVCMFIYGKANSSASWECQQMLQFNVGQQIPVAQMVTNPAGALIGLGASVTGMTIGAMQGNPIAVGNSAINGIQALKELIPKSNAKGSISGRSWISRQVISVTEYAEDTQDLDTPQVTHGRPLMEEVQLSTLSGFCQCANASVELNCMESDRDYVNSCLNSGFYIE